MNKEEYEVYKAYETIFHSPEGEIVLNDLFHKVFDGTFKDRDPVDVNAHMINHGRMSVLIDILTIINLPLPMLLGKSFEKVFKNIM
jgi:hypothetical protein